MTDAERVLSLLVHDLRTPLGVAHGYLRLIRADKLPAPEDRDRALCATQEALAKLSRLVTDASAYLEGPVEAGAGRAPATAVADRVRTLLEARGIAVAPAAADLPGTVAIGPNLDRAAEAFATLLATRAGRGADVRAAMAVDQGGLRLACGPDQAPATDITGSPFDPWQSSQGLTVVLAHRLLLGLGGEATIDGSGRAIALAVPLEKNAA